MRSETGLDKIRTSYLQLILCLKRHVIRYLISLCYSGRCPLLYSADRFFLSDLKCAEFYCDWPLQSWSHHALVADRAHSDLELASEFKGKQKDNKSELMLLRRATASVQFHTHGLSPVISAKIHSLDPSQSEIAKKYLKPRYFSLSRSFEVIHVGTPGKAVSSACYDKQQACVYLQPFSR